MALDPTSEPTLALQRPNPVDARLAERPCQVRDLGSWRSYPIGAYSTVRAMEPKQKHDGS